MHYYTDYFQHIPQDDFGWSTEWNNEIDKWLEYLYQINPTHYEQNKKRVLKDKQRDEFLGEIKTLYFLGRILGLKIIELEPQGKGKTKLDLSIEDLNNKLVWKVEVKSPSWKGQVWKDPNLTDMQKQARTSKPKIINGESKSFSSEEEIQYAAEDSIKNALPKFISGENNLLVITPDMSQNMLTMFAISAMAGGSREIQDELFLDDKDKLISTVLVLEPVLPSESGVIEYWHGFLDITSRPSLPSMAKFI